MQPLLLSTAKEYRNLLELKVNIVALLDTMRSVS